MSNQFIIKQSALKALVLLAAKKDVRYYLVGVNVEFSPSITRIVATDGHKLGLYQSGAQNVGHGALMIPTDTINALPKSGSYDPELTFIKCEGPGAWEIVGLPNNGRIVFQEIDGRFPDYQRVCNFKTDGQPGAYNPEYLMQFLKVQHLLGGSKKCTINVFQNGKSGALVTLAGVDNFYGVIMPMKTDADGVTGASVPPQFISDLKASPPALQAVA
jgi:DNA polymerase-3 subunit beta